MASGSLEPALTMIDMMADKPDKYTFKIEDGYGVIRFKGKTAGYLSIGKRFGYPATLSLRLCGRLLVEQLNKRKA